MVPAIGSAVYRKGTGLVPAKDDVNDYTLTFDMRVPNYFHLLSCEVVWKGKDSKGVVQFRRFPAKHLTVDMRTNIQTNSYLKPSFRQPYYLLRDHWYNTGIETMSELVTQYQNTPVVEVHFGAPVEGATVHKIRMDYLKLPEKINLTEDEVFVDDEDHSQLLEFPDYLKNTFVDKFMEYLMDNEMNPRIGQHAQVSQEIPKIPLELTGLGKPT